MCLGVKRHLASGHEISRLQHGLQLIMPRYTSIINCRPCCNLYVIDGWGWLALQTAVFDGSWYVTIDVLCFAGNQCSSGLVLYHCVVLYTCNFCSVQKSLAVVYSGENQSTRAIVCATSGVHRCRMWRTTLGVRGRARLRGRCVSASKMSLA